MRLSIPIHGNNPLKLGLLRHLMKLAGLLKMKFEWSMIAEGGEFASSEK